TNYIVHNGKLSFLFDAEHNTTATHSGEEVANGLIKAIRAVAPEKVCAIVTDNARNMRKAWKIVKREFPHIATIGCYAHGIQLFIGDVCKKVTEGPIEITIGDPWTSDGEQCNIFPIGSTSSNDFDDEDEFIVPLLTADEFGVVDGASDDDEDIQPEGDDETELHLPSTGSRARATVCAYSPNGIIASANWIARFFKSSPKALAKLHAVQLRLYGKRISICLPGATRWGSQLRCLQQVAKSRCAIEAVLNDEELKRDVRKDRSRAAKMVVVTQAVADSWFWECVHDFIYAMEPLVRILYVLESDSVTVAVAYDKIAEYASFLPKSMFGRRFPQVISLFQHRVQFLQNSRVGLAYLLDPRFRGRHLTMSHKAAVEDAVRKEFDIDVQCALAQYLIADGPFADERTWRISSQPQITPHAWWTIMKRECGRHVGRAYDAFCDLAMGLMCIPASSASSERSWSTFGFIHSDRRNRLDSERLKKLVRVYSHIRTERVLQANAAPRFSRFATTSLDDILRIPEYGGTDFMAALEELRLSLLQDVGDD
ncbi:MAG: DUF domain-containing protein, partial [Polynucleobacter sp.]|nr:DUF domain-containing protein [Polynucleobacter sp.]